MSKAEPIMQPIKKIVCPTDFSDASRTAATKALDLARQLGASVEFVHTYQLAGFASPTSALAADVAREARAELEAFVAALPSTGVTVDSHLRVGVPYAEIVAYAVESEAGLIVIGTTGKTGIQHFLLGSVAERVVQTSPVPVLTVRKKPTA